jgi:hypothetical protein
MLGLTQIRHRNGYDGILSANDLGEIGSDSVQALHTCNITITIGLASRTYALNFFFPKLK